MIILLIQDLIDGLEEINMVSETHISSERFDVKEDQVYSNIKQIAKKAQEHNKIAGIHKGTINYAKEMIDLGYKFITISSDFRAMTAYAQNVVKEMKNIDQKKEEQTY